MVGRYNQLESSVLVFRRVHSQLHMHGDSKSVSVKISFEERISAHGSLIAVQSCATTPLSLQEQSTYMAAEQSRWLAGFFQLLHAAAQGRPV